MDKKIKKVGAITGGKMKKVGAMMFSKENIWTKIKINQEAVS